MSWINLCQDLLQSKETVKWSVIGVNHLDFDFAFFGEKKKVAHKKRLDKFLRLFCWKIFGKWWLKKSGKEDADDEKIHGEREWNRKLLRNKLTMIMMVMMKRMVFITIMWKSIYAKQKFLQYQFLIFFFSLPSSFILPCYSLNLFHLEHFSSLLSPPFIFAFIFTWMDSVFAGQSKPNEVYITINIKLCNFVCWNFSPLFPHYIVLLVLLQVIVQKRRRKKRCH